ncbi:MAG: glycosyltransferase family 4 protein [Prevotella sp.]|nr:glycosyltransferase family 4 protein [Prevotella sp.]
MMKIVYCTPSIYIAGGVERVLALKANYFAERFGYDITIILTDGAGKQPYYPLSDKVKVINLDIGFEELWTCSFIKKVFVYLRKQRLFKRKLRTELMRLCPDITVSMLRREINFITDIKDGSRKIGELHVNKANYRNFNESDSNMFKRLFARFWMASLVSKLKRLDRFVVLTDEDLKEWHGLDNVASIPDPLSFTPSGRSNLTRKRVIAVGRYCHEKGFDLLLKAWSKVEKECTDWELAIFGMGEREPYERLTDELGIDRSRCRLNGSTRDIEREYTDSALFVLSSRFEGFGMVLVEAMACGLPAVAFDGACGPRSIISHGEDGLLVPAENTDKLADAMVQLMKSPERIKQMADKAVVKSQQYDIDIIAGKWRALFEDVYNKK